jgi:outer membrane protein TolC
MGGSAEYLPEAIKLEPLQISGTVKIKSLQTYCNMAIARRSDLAAERSELQISRYRHLQGYSNFMPTVRFLYSGTFSNNNLRYADYRYDASRYNHFANSYGALAEWNIFEGFASYNLLRELQTLEEAAQYRLQERFLQVLNEVSDARENIINASGQLELYRQSLQWVFEQRQLVQAEYNAAKATITRLNGAQSDLIRAENMLAIAQIELNKAIIQLQTAIEGDYCNLPQHKILQPSTLEPFDKLLQKLTDKFKL